MMLCWIVRLRLDSLLGERLPGWVDRHTDSCPACGKVRGIRRILDRVLGEHAVDPAGTPDLWSPVRARIGISTSRPREIRWRWALGGAALVIASTVVLSVLLLGPGRNPQPESRAGERFEIRYALVAGRPANVVLYRLPDGEILIQLQVD